MALGMFLQLDGIDGSVNDARHGGEISVVSWGFCVHHPRPSDVGGPVDPERNSLDLVVVADAATPRMLVTCLDGSVIARGRITVRAGSGVEIFIVEMEGVVVTRLGATAQHTDNQPTAEVSLACQRVGGIYTPQLPSGEAGEPVSGGWDLIADREWAVPPQQLY